MISFGVKYWFLLLLAALLISVLASLLSYYRNRAVKDFSKVQVVVLAILRFLSVFMIGVLLLSPFIRNLKKITQEPIIITAWDNSASLTNNPDSLELVERIAEVRKNLINRLEEKFTVVEYGFGEQTIFLDQLTFSGKQSDYSEMITTIYNNHFNENIGALVVAGDGIYNSGRNPVNQLSDINFPIYTIGLGDTTEVMDAGIRNIRVNRTSFAGNKFPVEVDLQFKKLNGRPLELTLSDGTNVLHSTVITPSNENYFTTKEFVLEAGEAGMKHFSARIEQVRQERNTANNRAGFVINVLENKQKILILSNGPHPDIGAIRNTLEQQQTYDVTTFTQDPFPNDLSEYNLIILNQLPSPSKSISGILQRARESRIPLLYIVGNKTFLNQFNTLSSGATITPLELSGEEAQATVNPAYSSFNLSDELKEIIPDFPPLQVSFADYGLEAEFTPLLYQKILNIETNKPLIATGIYEERKIGFIFGEGIWRWRLYDYYTHQNNRRFNEMVNKLIQFLALRMNEENLVVHHKMVNAEIDEIIFNAEVYDDAFERVPGAEINLEIVNSNGDEYKFTFDASGINYRLNAGHFPTGDYLFRASVEMGNNQYEKEGSFTVMPVNMESTVTRANHNMLFNLASGSGGTFYAENEVDLLLTELLKGNQLNSTSYYQEMVNALMDQKWIFLLILLLLSVEWFLRKFWGVY